MSIFVFYELQISTIFSFGLNSVVRPLEYHCDGYDGWLENFSNLSTTNFVLIFAELFIKVKLSFSIDRWWLENSKNVLTPNFVWISAQQIIQSSNCFRQCLRIFFLLSRNQFLLFRGMRTGIAIWSLRWLTHFSSLTTSNLVLISAHFF